MATDEETNWDAHAEMNPVLRSFMRNQGRPPTRDEYIDLIWGDQVPEEWTAEHEAQLPGPLQRPPG